MRINDPHVILPRLKRQELTAIIAQKKNTMLKIQSHQYIVTIADVWKSLMNPMMKKSYKYFFIIITNF
jgi:hypothetical protein